MRKLLSMLLFIVMVTAFSPIKSGSTINSVEISGTIEKMGITTFQYGSHLLKAASNSFALKSSTVNLDSYLGKIVKVKGIKVQGYPVENGPEFIEVSEIMEK